MPRRPSGHVATQRKLLIAFGFLLLPLVTAEAQQRQSRPDVHHPNINRPEPAPAHVLDTNNAPGSGANDDGGNGNRRTFVQPDPRDYATVKAEPPRVRKRTSSSAEDHVRPPNYKYNNLQHPDDASALATLALGPSTDGLVRAPLLGHRAISSDGGYDLATPHSARSLGDWEVEDFALLATVDGDLIAVDRATGQERWNAQLSKPVVETEHKRLNATPLSDDSHSPIDNYIWAIEPDPKGHIYLIMKGQTVPLRMPLSMKKLVDQTPYFEKEFDIMYTGESKHSIGMLDPNTGSFLRWYGSDGDEKSFNEFRPDICSRGDDFANSDRCTIRGTLAIGRTDYTVVVRRKDGPIVATLKYSEWGPAKSDMDLETQYRSSFDGRYIMSNPATSQLRVTSNKGSREDRPESNIATRAPIARVFDVARPRNAPASSNPELVLLPQPPIPAKNDEETFQRSVSTFIGKTKNGSYYALSGALYPGILDSNMARSSVDGWWDHHHVQDLDHTKQRNALTGLHVSSAISRSAPHPKRPTIGTPPPDEEIDNRSFPALPAPLQDPANITIIDKVKELPQVAATSVLDFFSNPTLFVIIFVLLLVFQQDLRRGYARSSLRSRLDKFFSKNAADIPDDQSADGSVEHEEGKEEAVTKADDTVKVTVTSSLAEIEPKVQLGSEVEVEVEPKIEAERKVEIILPTIPETVAEAESLAPSTTPSEREASPPDASAQTEAPASAEEAQPEKKKKRQHRGRRGGNSHKKKGSLKPELSNSSMGDEQGNGTVEDAVRNAQKLGDATRQIEPDIVTVNDDVQAVTGPMISMGDLTVDEDKQLGTGSNGTVVYAGNYDGRAVAVKRMLVQFNEIATQETKLLRESDSHENVIRYYTQYQRGPFLYIALQLCEASLADVIERPHLHQHLRQAGEKSLPKVLYQITKGISYLHSLRIVHRDLKPQNILVNMGRDGDVRLLVSDFGLCKKLEGGQSSFGATTAHAAGTSGWRAPELLLDDDSRDPNRSLADVSSTHSGSGSVVSPELLPNRRVGRSIDIFSLGLVFFYVLTRGQHPFDCGDRYMREVNIRKGEYNLDSLQVLGEYAEEAKYLIEWMLCRQPRERPVASEVMRHPFFWTIKRRLAFLVDVSDHFEHECRDPPSAALVRLEDFAPTICGKDFLKQLPREFLESLGKQRKYTGTRLLDLLRALRNKKNHYEDMEPSLKRMVGTLPDGYLFFWTTRFPALLLCCWNLVYELGWHEHNRFSEYYEPAAIA